MHNGSNNCVYSWNQMTSADWLPRHGDAIGSRDGNMSQWTSAAMASTPAARTIMPHCLLGPWPQQWTSAAYSWNHMASTQAAGTKMPDWAPRHGDAIGWKFCISAAKPTADSVISGASAVKTNSDGTGPQ